MTAPAYAPAPVATPAPVSAPVPAAAPVAAPSYMHPPVAAPAPAAAPVAVPAPAAAPVAAAAPSAPPMAGGLGAAPQIGSLPAGAGGGIPDEHFGKPILFRLLAANPRYSSYEKEDVQAPTVDYIVLDPATGQMAEVRNLTIMQKNIRRDLVACFMRGEQAITAVATKIPTDKQEDAKVLRPLDDQNSGYGAEQATAYLRDAAINMFAWWTQS